MCKNHKNTYVWYCACRKLNSSFILSKVSAIVNLIWPPCGGGPCKKKWYCLIWKLNQNTFKKSNNKFFFNKYLYLKGYTLNKLKKTSLINMGNQCSSNATVNAISFIRSMFMLLNIHTVYIWPYQFETNIRVTDFPNKQEHHIVNSLQFEGEKQFAKLILKV